MCSRVSILLTFHFLLTQVLTGEDSIVDFLEAHAEVPTRNFSPEKAASILQDNFHMHDRDNVTIIYMSDPVDFGVSI